jgi:tricorn protease
MKEQGYYRYATIFGDTVVFSCEDYLWAVSTRGGTASRITSNRGECSLPKFSPDGQSIAFVGRTEGHPEVYVMNAEGGLPRRLSYLGGETCVLCGWSGDGKEVYFVSDAQSPFLRHSQAFAVPLDGGSPRPLNLGHMQYFDVSKSGKFVIGRNNLDPARWKRYLGGTSGDIWVQTSKEQFKPLLKISGNHVAPMWIGEKIFFLSDHEGIGNLYSCNQDGQQIKRHTDHDEYYVRFPSTDGKRIVYTAGGDIYIYDVQQQKSRKLDVLTPVTGHQSQRKFVECAAYLEHFAPHPDGHSLAVIARGQPLTFGNWEGAVVQHGSGSRGRSRNCEWLNDGQRIIFVNDSEGYERLEIHSIDQSKAPEQLSGLDLGRVLALTVSPTEDKICVTNHRHELLIINLVSKELKVLDKSPAERIKSVSWSGDGRWLAYTFSPHALASIIKIADIKSGETKAVTRELKNDYSPSFDPDGRYLYFLSNRDFFPVYDSTHFDLGFPTSARPYCIPLRKDIPSPFIKRPKPVHQAGRNAAGNKNDDNKSEDKHGDKHSDKHSDKHADKHQDKGGAKGHVSKAAEHKTADDKGNSSKKSSSVSYDIDFDGIESRILAFPVDEGRFGQIVGLKNRVVFSRYHVRGIRPNFSFMDESSDAGWLIAYDLEEQRAANVIRELNYFKVARDNRTLVYRWHKQGLRVVDGGAAMPAEGVEPSAAAWEYSRKAGWINLGRAKILINPRSEWKQMYEEAWRLQSEQFWDSKMSDVDWNLVHDRYHHLLPRIRTRSDLSDLIWEMQGELGTSHAYEFGGDYTAPPNYQRGFLGADLSWQKSKQAYKIERIIRGDSWNQEVDSPLALPGLRIEEGEFIHAVDGREVSAECSIEELLMNKPMMEIDLTISSDGKKKRHVTVRTLYNERMLRYRNWVEANRKMVFEKSRGRVGYIHIPDMGPWGYAEFHRSYLAEYDRDALIVDVRYNRGGHVSALLLEKLARKRVGYDCSRWGEPMPYPMESAKGLMVGLTNQFAGSDGDIFSHCFKLYKLGPLVGKRTWGGVIGIEARHRLVDGTLTTQPEFSFWFFDVGFKVENYGAEPDHEVDISPQDYRQGLDPQMEKALELLRSELKRKPPEVPDFSDKPSLALPKSKKPMKGQSVNKKEQSIKKTAGQSTKKTTQSVGKVSVGKIIQSVKKTNQSAKRTTQSAKRATHSVKKTKPKR